MDGALLHAELLGEVMLDKLLMNHCKAHLLCKSCRNILSKRPHLSRHCDHSHGILLSVPGARLRDRCTAAPVAAQCPDPCHLIETCWPQLAPSGPGDQHVASREGMEVFSCPPTLNA